MCVKKTTFFGTEEQGQLEKNTEPRYKSPPTAEADVFLAAAHHAHSLEGCVAFAINPDWGVQWYNSECFDSVGQLRNEVGWVTWVRQSNEEEEWVDVDDTVAQSNATNSSAKCTDRPEHSEVLRIKLQKKGDEKGGMIPGLPQLWKTREFVLDPSTRLFSWLDDRGHEQKAYRLETIQSVILHPENPQYLDVITMTERGTIELYAADARETTKLAKHLQQALNDLREEQRRAAAKRVQVADSESCSCQACTLM